MSLTGKSILVTGGAGFIGSHIVEYLLQNNVKFVRILDNLATGSKSNIEPFLKEYDNVEFVWGDIQNLETCRRACQGMDVICHQAALGSVPRSIANPLDSHNTNVNGFFHMLLAAKENGIKRVVFASSSSVYGTNTCEEKIENENGTPLSPYAVTKYIDELYGNIFTRVYGMECIGLRYFNVFGPRQNPNGAYAAVIPKFINSVLRSQEPVINGDGSYSRDFTYVANAVSANVLALTTNNPECYGEIFNVGTNNTVTINELFDLICQYTERHDIRPTYGPVRAGDVPYSNASIKKTGNLLHYTPVVYFNDGLRKTVEYFMSQFN